MKTLKIALLSMFATAAMSAQDLKIAEVPSNLSTAFQKEYANATDVKWELEGMNYKVEFDLQKMEHEIWYAKDGHVVKSEKEIAVNELPSSISSAIKSKYADYKIDSIEVTQMDSKKTYEVELEKGWTTELKVVFDGAGAVLSTVED